ncbi:hypothetical protein U9M48_044016 [Paspalum notatum var. saurae]|uniref:Transmembrane protein n=1 Tax=Paspalum notatum var. saurae TaxID=547442 RepID=A0AAQ3UU55_PASNO
MPPSAPSAQRRPPRIHASAILHGVSMSGSFTHHLRLSRPLPYTDRTGSLLPPGAGVPRCLNIDDVKFRGLFCLGLHVAMLLAVVLTSFWVTTADGLPAAAAAEQSLKHSNSANELLLRRKLEEQQQAIELQIELPSHGISAARPQSSSREQLKLSSGFALDGKVNAGDKEEFGGEASPYNSDSEHRLPRCCGLWQQHRQWSNSF